MYDTETLVRSSASHQGYDGSVKGFPWIALKRQVLPYGPESACQTLLSTSLSVRHLHLL